jgi:predicted aldo/keto reductase-like oxidoreductase
MPNGGDELSILGFGCMRLPMTKQRTIDEPRAMAQIRSAIDQGVNYVDTAWPYHRGEGESFLGIALRDGYREKVKLATKLPSWLLHTREDMDRFLAAQLKKLQTDRIDYYLVHGLHASLWDAVVRLGVCEFLDKALADGRIGNAAFSFHGQPEDFKRIVDAYPWTCCQIQYNYMDENYQAGTQGLEYAAAKGLGVIVMEPLRGGKLASVVPPAVEAIWKEAKVQRTPAEWALRWLWNRPEVTVVLSGMNDEAQLRENIALASDASAGDLSADELALIKRAAEQYRALTKVGCTGCGYCLPCPSGVMIPGCFEVYNSHYMYNDGAEAQFTYALRMSGLLGDGQPGFASQCMQCGQCVDRCPQNIPIPESLAELTKEFEGPDLPDRVAAAKRMFGKGL